MASFWQNLLKTVFQGKNGLILKRAAQNCKMAKTALFWQNLLKTVCLGQTGFFFCERSLRQWLPQKLLKSLKRCWKLERAPFSRFEENLRAVWRFWELWRSKMRFGQNVLRMTWNERFVQFSWKAHCFPILKRMWGKFDDFDLLKTMSSGKNGWISERAAQNGKMAKMALFWQNLLKTVCFGQNGFFFRKSSVRQWFCPKLPKSENCLNQNCVIWQKWLHFGKTCSRPSFKAKTAWF